MYELEYHCQKKKPHPKTTGRCTNVRTCTNMVVEKSTRAARKASWNPAGVEPIHWILAYIDPGSRVSGTNRETT